MQKVIRRSILAEKQAARRSAKRKDRHTREWAKSNREQDRHLRREATGQIKQARLNRREDWELGPLAPRRDVGDSKDTFGTIHTQRMRGTVIHYKDRAEALKKVGGRFLNIVKSDRVVLLEGKDKGKIGKVTAVDPSRAECTVEGLNLIDVAIPSYMINEEDPDKRPIRTIEKPVPLTSVRLVYPLSDPETGITRDVIIKRLVNANFWFDRHLNRTSWRRMVPGLNISIPWPKLEPKEHKDGPDDTLRIDVEEKTFVPSLLRPPMPGTVIDELRNKFSKFRTRHDPEYIEAKLAEDRAVEEQKKRVTEMRTPLQEINRQERKLRKAKGKGKLTSEMLERIGQVIAKKRQLAKAPQPLAA
ncbi:related to ribosomal protein YmL40, mitochondrial [Phialocephala subalpina]|uniref:Related to ribosomal protein YmL40, mitochondrial n=1 Tax=Phialocephala subalpina TaxID=576137 RepID=A0A1L7X3V0_9HELO|nr:related to ribosomal protein YmL40, mitochondrial [Phialocephala subalpina]